MEKHEEPDSCEPTTGASQTLPPMVGEAKPAAPPANAPEDQSVDESGLWGSTFLQEEAVEKYEERDTREPTTGALQPLSPAAGEEKRAVPPADAPENQSVDESGLWGSTFLEKEAVEKHEERNSSEPTTGASQTPSPSSSQESSWKEGTTKFHFPRDSPKKPEDAPPETPSRKAEGDSSGSASGGSGKSTKSTKSGESMTSADREAVSQILNNDWDAAEAAKAAEDPDYDLMSHLLNEDMDAAEAAEAAEDPYSDAAILAFADLEDDFPTLEERQRTIQAIKVSLGVEDDDEYFEAPVPGKKPVDEPRGDTEDKKEKDPKWDEHAPWKDRARRDPRRKGSLKEEIDGVDGEYYEI